MTIPQILKAFIRMNRWPFYFKLFYIKYYKQYIWKKKNINLGKNIKWLGYPIISKYKGSSINIGDDCLICSLSTQTALGVTHPVIIRTLNSKSRLFIGNKVRMSGTSICASNSITIGNRCVIGADVIIADTDFHALDPIKRSSLEDSKNALTSPVVIGDDVFIGGRSIILKGVTLGDSVIVGAGSVVTKSFEPNSIIAGNPAKLIKKHLF